jgi:hypothetical protein
VLEMKNRVSLSIIVSLLVAACNTTNEVRPTAWQVIQQACNNPKNHSNEATCAMNHPMFSQLTPQQREYVAFGSVVEDRLKNGQMTAAEANYALTQKANEMNLQAQIIAAQNAQAAAADMAIANQDIANGIALMQAGRPQPTYTPQPMMNTQCRNVGIWLNCTSY